MELYTVRETANLLRVSEITVRRYIADGRLPAVRVGRSVRVEKEAVERLPNPVKPVEPREKSPRKRRKPRYFTEDDPLWKLVGAFDDPEGPTDVSENKGKYLAEAALDLHE
jgi:excisionase family DNA binding protein